MLEYDFNQLDDDFITLWSKFMLSYEKDDIIVPLEQLAEKGQINAIQQWYIWKNPEHRNKNIDDIVKGFTKGTFNEAYAIACATYSKNKNQMREVGREISRNKILGIANFDKKYFELNDRLIEELKSSDYVKQISIVATFTLMSAQTTNNCLIYERLLEIYRNNSLFLDSANFENSLSNFVKEALLKKLDKEPKDPKLLFALAKNLIYFSWEEKDVLKGKQILSTLSKRPLICCNYQNSQEDTMNK